MWTRIAIALGLGLSAVVTGCSIENCEEGAICVDEDSDERTCSASCRRLAECGRVDEAARGLCIDACLEQVRYEYDALADYRGCIEETTCSALREECGQAPFELSPPPRGGDVPERDVVKQDAGPAPVQVVPAQDASVSAPLPPPASGPGSAHDAGPFCEGVAL